MFSQVELGRIGGIPIVLDMMFVLVLIVFSYPYFTSGDTQDMSAGLVIIAGILASILLHELGHAIAGRLFGTRVTHIALTGLGGVTQFERSLPKSAFARTVIYLAGPAANLLLWLGFDALSRQDVVIGRPMLDLAILVLANVNLFLLIFNLLPAFPLDGGHTLNAWLGVALKPSWPVKIVAGLGLAIAVLLAISAFPSNVWRLLLALFLFQVNWTYWQQAGRWR